MDKPPGQCRTQGAAPGRVDPRALARPPPDLRKWARGSWRRATPGFHPTPQPKDMPSAHRRGAVAFRTLSTAVMAIPLPHGEKTPID